MERIFSILTFPFRMKWTPLTLLGVVISFILEVLRLSYRFTFVGLENMNACCKMSPSGAFLAALWHQNAIAGLLSYKGKPLSIIISRSKDGEVVSQVSKNLGFIPIRGSSSRGGQEARLEMCQLIRRGIPGAITVDGPRGPLYTVKPGIFQIAFDTQTPILPSMPFAQRYFTFHSWDLFRLPKLLTPIVIEFGEPMVIDKNPEGPQLVAYQRELQNRLFQLEQKNKTLNEKNSANDLKSF
jgi:lysophospholipid acyltransferase (LPLAT)-like uncharacterized protein